MAKDYRVNLACPNCTKFLGFSSVDGVTDLKSYSAKVKSDLTCGHCKQEVKAGTELVRLSV